ncbi:peptidase T4 [Chromatiales bacterium (ex Bugula neritina AB1)]|nr:peptidase T4 [Chromatiales bacterium (ex Bugula neritina AB1)]
MQVNTGNQNLITDVAGLRVGNAQDRKLKSGSTVLLADAPFVAAVDVRGGAPGTRETDLLAPDKLVDAIDAIVLSGGSAFGLDAASGVTDALHQAGRGFAVGEARVPLVSAAIIFDLLNGGNKCWSVNPYRKLGAQAIDSAAIEFELGSAGAGTGASCSDIKGGLGSASVITRDGHTVGALVVVNPRGSVLVPGSGHFWAAPFEIGEEFGGYGISSSAPDIQLHDPRLSDNPKANTTIAVVATDAELSVAQAQRVAIAAHDGLARAILPSHTPLDGDLVFSISTGQREMRNPVSDHAELCHAAALCLSRAIARGVFEASAEEGDLLPCWRSAWGS